MDLLDSRNKHVQKFGTKTVLGSLAYFLVHDIDTGGEILHNLPV